MAITWLVPHRRYRATPISDKRELLRRFEGQQKVTIATGVTCAYLGDERNLREFLVASEAANTLRRAGHLVSFRLFDDSLDALTPKQLRIAANKHSETIEKFQHFCGTPISEIPSPVAGSHSWAEHFEKLLLKRLAQYDCYPSLESSSHLYASGVYKPYVDIVLKRGTEIRRFIQKEFPGYRPQALFYPICPCCGRIKGTSLKSLSEQEVEVTCEACGLTSLLPVTMLRGKLNWKIDCAARWKIFEVDLEPFTKAYLEPNAGAFWIAHALGNEFFGKVEAQPLQIGLVKVDDDLDPRTLGCLPSHALVATYIEHWNTDIDLTRDRLRLAASKPHEVDGKSYIEKIKRELPLLKARKHSLTIAEHAFLQQAELFQREVLSIEAESTSDAVQVISRLDNAALWGVSALLRESVELRRKGVEYHEFDETIKGVSHDLGSTAKAVHATVRELLEHRKGLPLRRLLFNSPLSTLDLMRYAVERTLDVRHAAMQLAKDRVQPTDLQHAVIAVPETHPSSAFTSL